MATSLLKATLDKATQSHILAKAEMLKPERGHQCDINATSKPPQSVLIAKR
jgi:hypothetical protein